MSTHTRYLQNGYQFLDRTPETFATFSICKTKPDALAWMVCKLAWPLMTVCMEDRESKLDPRKVFAKKAIHFTAAMQLAPDII